MSRVANRSIRSLVTLHGWRAVRLLKGVPKMSRNRNEINPFDEWFPASAVTASTAEPESEALPIEFVDPETLGLT